MNIDSIINSLSNLWARHSPTVIMHIAIFVLLQSWVLDPHMLVFREPVWQSVKSGVASALTEAGITAPVGYALAALGYIYLNIFQWLAALVIRLPGLRPWYISEPSLQEDFARYAGRILRTPPDMFATRKQVDTLVENYVRRFRERSEPEPYHWLQLGIAQWNRFYGLSVLGAFATLLWLWEGGRGSISANRVVELALLLILFAVYSRWQYAQKSRYRTQQIRYGALHEYESAHPDESEPDELKRAREDMLFDSARYWKAYYRHPVTVIMRWVGRLPRRVREPLSKRIAYINVPRSELDWDLLCSKSTLFSENAVVPPIALDVNPYRDTFRSLLECRGAGIFLLADARSGLAPSVDAFGSEYCFATRRHGGSVLKIRYRAGFGSDPGTLHTDSYKDHWSVLADIGPHPVELAAQWQFPSGTPEKKWWELTSSTLDTDGWSSSKPGGSEDLTVGGIPLQTRMPVSPGHSYLLRARMQTGTQAIVVFQCFATGTDDRILIAWKILDVIRKRNAAVMPLPWWNPKAWNGLIRWNGK